MHFGMQKGASIVDVDVGGGRSTQFIYTRLFA
jgi:hypothetical protein